MKKLFIILHIFFLSSVMLFSQSKNASLESLGLDKLVLRTNPTLSSKKNIFQNHIFEVEKINPLRTKVNVPILIGVGTLYFGAGAYINSEQRKAWWQNQRGKFHFVNDWEYALWIDKAGHFFGTQLLAHTFTSAFDAADVPTEEGIIIASTAALLFQLYIEHEDGYATNWGFSPGDASANVLGALYPILRFYYPYLNNFSFKMSYWPANLNKVDPISGHETILTDDHEGHKFWLSARMNNLLPNKLEKYWPDFLALAVGMGVKDLDGLGGGTRDFYIALDFDAEKIPLFGRGWQFVKNTLNLVRFPMPGIRITNGVAFFAIVY